MLIDPITTPRLSLCVLKPEHASILQHYLQENRQHLAPWEPIRDDRYFELAQCEERLHQQLQQMAAGNGVFLALMCDQQMIGNCHFSNIVRGVFQACHLGYAIAHTHQGKGYMTEALKAAIQHMFEQEKLHRIMANYLPENVRSAGVLERLGFKKEGYAKSYLKINGAWRDHVLTALISTTMPE
ncbi:GNAT family N-acetyltransferase [Undibacterium sp. Dicai25W]|uniref:GNAT family N-acetyltransferase n=1 Tax=Undibacterium sp. Dicai25W TaxID=3413034 RepID=UPI003BF28A4B